MMWFLIKYYQKEKEEFVKQIKALFNQPNNGLSGQIWADKEKALKDYIQRVNGEIDTKEGEMSKMRQDII